MRQKMREYINPEDYDTLYNRGNYQISVQIMTSMRMLWLHQSTNSAYTGTFAMKEDDYKGSFTTAVPGKKLVRVVFGCGAVLYRLYDNKTIMRSE